MQQIAKWLEKLGMPEYNQRFTDNDIGFTILSDLTDQDLEKIGVASLGHRRKLLRAIAALETIEKSTPAVDAVVAPAASLPLSGGLLSPAAALLLELPTPHENQRGNKIQPINRYRESTGVGLKEAKDFIEEVQRRAGASNITPRVFHPTPVVAERGLQGPLRQP